MLLKSLQQLGGAGHYTGEEGACAWVAAVISNCVRGGGIAEGLLVEPCTAFNEGDNLLDIAQANDLEMEGACGGSCACSTCHVIVEDEAKYEAMEEPDDDENDMLDLAFGLTETSRLGCQVKMSKELDGLVVRLPSMTRNLQASDFK
ncbi:mitochondrial matrix iron-sulfur protein [Nothophoma quercina]|uniref:Mitochondrial matrix iron-sulfur protein n=1 Tax=Nothophoma quercina TaxID=749835 RepID=A0ABR3QM06_9PLEO